MLYLERICSTVVVLRLPIFTNSHLSNLDICHPSLEITNTDINGNVVVPRSREMFIQFMYHMYHMYHRTMTFYMCSIIQIKLSFKRFVTVIVQCSKCIHYFCPKPKISPPPHHLLYFRFLIIPSRTLHLHQQSTPPLFL